MRSRPCVSLLLAAALLLGQWLAAAHEPEHALQPGAAHACAVCVYAHGAGAGALPTPPRMVLGGHNPFPDAVPAAGPLAGTAREHPIRGPPALLA